MIPFLFGGGGGSTWDNMDDWTVGEVRAVRQFISDGMSVVYDHALIYLGEPNHDCDSSVDIGPDDGDRMTDAELRAFFALEDSMKLYLKFVRAILVANGQISVEVPDGG